MPGPHCRDIKFGSYIGTPQSFLYFIVNIWIGNLNEDQEGIERA